MSNTCPEHNIDLTESGECPECSRSHAEPDLDDNDQVEHQSFEDENLKTAADEETNPEPETEESDLLVDNTIDVDSSNIEKFSPTQVGYVKEFRQFTAYLGSPKNDDSQIKVSLFGNSETFELKDYDDLDNSPVEIIQNFKRERILLLGGSGDKTSSRASHQIARSLEINNKKENIRLLDLSNYATYPLSVQSISPKRKSSGKEILQDALVIVNAVKEGDKFAGSLLDSSVMSMEHYRTKLKDNKLYMICLIKADSINDWLKEDKTIELPYWIIPGKKDKAQSTENEHEINRRVEEILNLNIEADNRIIKIILFIVSFFSDLTANDFNDLVNKWLKKESEAAIEVPGKNGSNEKILTPKPLSEVWKLKSRYLTEKCFLKKTVDEQTGRRIIGFHNELYAERIKKILEDKYWAFVDEKVSEILRMRLIFHPSDNIASQTAAILAEYFPGNEEDFIDWLLWAFNILNDEENRAENIRQILGIRDSDDVEETGRRYFYYKRLAELFREVLRNSSQKKNVSNIMERLIQDHCYQSALMLVKRLQYAPNFDEEYWLRQLLERGDAKTKGEIKKYLFNGLINSDINDVLNKLKEWLPQENSPSGKYSQINKAALELLIKYYAYQINIFDEELYGSEPTQFALFVFESRSSASGQLDLLVKYLLHPLSLSLKLEGNLRLKLKGMPYIYYAAFLLERWSRILCENNLATTTATNNGEELSNREILNTLLGKVVLACSVEEQEKIKSVWTEIKNVHDAVYRETSDWKVREQVIREREFLTNLIELFNTKQWALK
jgi:hypothetical protein